MHLNYTVTNIDPIGFKTISETDAQVISSFVLNKSIDLKRDKIELHIYSYDGGLLESHINHATKVNFKLGSSAGKDGTSEITLTPIEDAKFYGYENGGIINVYNFTKDLYSEDNSPKTFYIQEISPDRTELLLLTGMLSNEEVIEYTDILTNRLESSAHLESFRLNFGNNNLVICTNIKTFQVRDYQAVAIKLYRPLPDNIQIRDLASIEEMLADTVAYEIESEVIQDEITVPFLKGPNFGLSTSKDISAASSEKFSYEDLFSFDNINNFRELKSYVAEKGVDVSVDYSNYENFINYSSADERLRNFKYKLDLLESHQTSIDRIENGVSVDGGITGSREYYKDLIDSIIENFDHYDKHLYYESGSTSWPKVNDIKPYINATGSATGSYYTAQLISASNYDDSNPHQLINSIPSFLRDDPDNDLFQLFVNLVGQHYDNIWIYTKAVTDKYDADNRTDKGISKDLVEVALKNFGVKVYNSSRSTLDLFRMYTGELFDTGSESNLNNLVSASNNPTSEDVYRKEIYKRVYHNLPLLLKSKGTEKGMRVLANSFGIPTLNSMHSGSSMMVRTGGNSNTLENVNLGQFTLTTSSYGKIKIDDTGSIVTGNTLSRYVSINKRNDKYTHTTNNVEIGYSPTDHLNDKIIEYLNSL